MGDSVEKRARVIIIRTTRRVARRVLIETFVRVVCATLLNRRLSHGRNERNLARKARKTSAVF